MGPTCPLPEGPSCPHSCAVPDPSQCRCSDPAEAPRAGGANNWSWGWKVGLLVMGTVLVKEVWRWCRDDTRENSPTKPITATKVCLLKPGFAGRGPTSHLFYLNRTAPHRILFACCC